MRARDEDGPDARALHAQVVASVGTVACELGALDRLLGPTPALDAIHLALTAATNDLRRMDGLLGTGPAASRTGLRALAHLVDDERRAGMPVSWSLTPADVRLNATSALAAYRIIQAIVACLRHEGDLALRTVAVTVDDDGAHVLAQLDPGAATVPALEEEMLPTARALAGAAGGALTVTHEDHWCCRIHLPR